MMNIQERMERVADDCANRNYKKATHYKITAQKDGNEMTWYAYSLPEVTRRIRTMTILGYRYQVEIV